MDTVIVNIKNTEQKKLFVQIAKMLHIEINFLSEEEKEDISLLNAMIKSRKEKRVSKAAIIKELRK